MIENYIYSIPRKKKIIYVIMLSLLFLSLLSAPVKSGPFSALTGEITDNITDEIFTGVNQSLGEAVGSILDWVLNVFTKSWGPDLKTFVENTRFGGISAETFINGFAVSSGLFIATLIWGFSMFAYFFSGKFTDSKDTPISLTVRYALAIAICYKHKTIIDTVMGLIDDLYTAYTESAISEAVGEAGFLNVLGEVTDHSLSMFGVVLTFSIFPGVRLIVLIIGIVLIWKLLKGFFQLYMEMISRYIVTMVLLCLFSAFGATIVSNNTNQVFKSYLKTLFCSFMVMLFNIMWFKMCFFTALVDGGVITSFFKYLFLLELLHFGTKFDGMLRSMGLGVATGGSRIASAVGGAGRNLTNAVRSANSMIKAAGGLLAAGGVALGNKSMHDIGKVMGAGAKDIAAGTLNKNSPEAFAQSLGTVGKRIDNGLVSGEQAAGMMSKLMANPKNPDAQNAVRALSPDKLREGAQAMVGDNSGISVGSANLCSYITADGTHKTGIRVSGTTEDGSSFSGVIGESNDFTSGTELPDKDGLVLHTDNSLMNGETCDVNNAAMIAGSEVSKALEDAQDNGFNFNGATIEKDGRDSNGRDSFNVIGENGTQLGVINGDQFTMSGECLDDKERKEAFSKMKDVIMSGGNYESMTDFQAIEGETGKYKATATDNNGFNRDFIATDKGMYQESKMNDHAESFSYTDNSFKNGEVSYSYDVNAGKSYRPQAEGNITENVKFGSGSSSNNTKRAGSGDNSKQKNPPKKKNNKK